MTHTHTRFAVVSAFVLFSPFASADRDPPERPPAYERIPSEASCGEESQIQNRKWWRWEPSDVVEDQVRQIACTYSIVHEGLIEKRVYGEMHYEFDDRRFHHLRAAMILALCAGAQDGEHFRCNKHTAGQMLYYAQRLKMPIVQKATSQLKLPEDVKQHFLARVTAARDLVVAETEKLDPRRKELYVTLPTKIRAAREKHFQTYAAHWEKLDALTAKIDQAIGSAKDRASLLAETQAAREAYVTACLKEPDATLEQCMGGPIGRPLTANIIRLALAAKEGMLALVESGVLEKMPDTSTAIAQMFFAQYQAFEAESKKAGEYEAAKAKNVDKATLKSMFGDPPPIKVDTIVAWDPPQPASYEGLVEPYKDSVEWLDATVQAVSAKGARATIQFKKEAFLIVDESCRETNRIDRIDNDGRIRYREICKVKSVKKGFKTINPVTVPAAEARHLRSGHSIVIAYDPKTRNGLVVRVYPNKGDQTPIQLRDLAERPTKA